MKLRRGVLSALVMTIAAIGVPASAQPSGLERLMAHTAPSSTPGVAYRDGDWNVFSMAASPSGDLVYAGSGGGSYVVIDSATGSWLKIANNGGSGANWEINVSADGRRLYFANGDGSVYVVDATTYSVIAKIAVTSTLGAEALSPDGKRLYVTSGSNTVKGFWAIDTATNKIVGGPYGDFAWYSDLVVSPDSRQIYAAAGKVGAFDTDGNIFRVLDLGEGIAPDRMFLNKNGDRLYSTVWGKNEITVSETINGGLIKSFPVQKPTSVEATADGASVYATSYETGEILQLDVASGSIAARMPTGSQAWSLLLMESRGAVWAGALNQIRAYGLPLTSAQAQAAVVPSAVRGAYASVTKSGVATVTWDGPAQGLASDFTVTMTPGGKTCSTGIYQCSFKGLKKGKRYAFAIVASGPAGTGPQTSVAVTVPKPHEKPKPAPKPRPVKPSTYSPPPPVIKPQQIAS